MAPKQEKRLSELQQYLLANYCSIDGLADEENSILENVLKKVGFVKNCWFPFRVNPGYVKLTFRQLF
jgi:hypothetical protein